MKKIQYLSINKASFDNFTCSTFTSPVALDSFEVNIIDFNDYHVFDCGVNPNIFTDSIRAKQDLLSLKDMIANSRKSIQLFLLPSNVEVYYGDGYRSQQYSSTLKNELGFLSSFLSRYSFVSSNLSIGFEHNVTEIGNKSFESDFYFKKADTEIITRAKDTGKTTTIKSSNNTVLTFVKFDNQDDLIMFLIRLGYIENVSDYPDWLHKYLFYNDKAIYLENESFASQIKTLQANINENNLKLQSNFHFKSILFETGDKLVKVVFEILEEMLDIDLSNFKDELKEDFLFKNNGITYIGEIKGINAGIGNANISQVDDHKSQYEDELQAKGELETIKKILVINDQRKTPINDRVEIHPNQIAKAKKDEVLIIRTLDLLKIFEQYKFSKISREGVFKILEEQTGPIKY